MELALHAMRPQPIDPIPISAQARSQVAELAAETRELRDPDPAMRGRTPAATARTAENRLTTSLSANRRETGMRNANIATVAAGRYRRGVIGVA